MSYIEVLSEGTRIARKHHQCYDCCRSIAPGEEYLFQVCKYDNVYTIKQHTDCRAASEEYRSRAGLSFYDFVDGIPPIREVISDEFEHECSLMRGYFPHVVCRMEFIEQKAGIRLGETPSS